MVQQLSGLSEEGHKVHIDFHLEGSSDEALLKPLMKQLLLDAEGVSYEFYYHGGIKNLLKKLRGRLQDFARQYSYDEGACVFVICDLDNKNKEDFLNILNAELEKATPKPKTFFCLAIEEMEAWLLGDIPAILEAYPRAKRAILKSYKQDSICQTAEFLERALNTGINKLEWAEKIADCMNVENNKSPSFCYFRDTLRDVVNAAVPASG